MSMFLPESSETKLQPGVAEPTNPEVTDDDLKLMQRVLSAAGRYPNAIPDQFMAYLMDYVQTGKLIIPIGQVFGFQQFISTQVSLMQSTGTSAASHTFAGGEAASSTAGPTITLGDAGKYVVLCGVDISADPAVLAASLVVSGGGPTVVGGIPNGGGGSFAGFAALTEAADATVLTSTFNAGPNSAGTPRDAAFANAKIVAIRYDNP